MLSHQMNQTMILIDGNSLVNRAYYAIQRPMITRDGLYTHAVYGFLNILNRLIREHDPQYLIVAFDRKAPTFRHQEFTDYKAGRKKMPPELAMQLPLLKEALSAMQISMLEIDGFEADDIIGTVAKNAEQEGLDTLIITGDKDELQLASDHTRVLITKKGISEFELYDRAAMEEKYGLTPDQFVDLKGLMGDSSDNIPGIPGIGEKTALKLLQEFGSVAELIRRSDEISSDKLKEKVQEYAQQALMSRRLAEIYTQVPLTYTLEECKVVEPDYPRLIDFYHKMEFNSLLGKLKDVKKDVEGNKDQAPNQREKTVDPSIQVIRTKEQLEPVLAALQIESSIVLKVFHNDSHRSTPMIYGICLLSTKAYWYIECTNKEVLSSVFSALHESQVELVGHDLKTDYYALLSTGMDRIAMQGGAWFRTGFDTAIAAYLVEPGRSKYQLETLFLEYYHEELPALTEVLTETAQLSLGGDEENRLASYGLRWCQAVAAVKAILEERIKAFDLQEVLHHLEFPLIEVLASMEQVGFAVDRQVLQSIGAQITGQLFGLEHKIHDLAGEVFNVNSPKQLGVILFEKLKLPAGKKNKNGYSTGAEILERLKDDHEIIPMILEYRMLSKLSSTYIEGLTPLIHEDGRIHAHFQQTIAATGRISCTEPNLQNIPIRTELGRQLRKAFVTGAGNQVLMGADYSQIELRILAHLSGDEVLIQAFQDGDDIHRITASRVFGVPEDQVTMVQRSNAKAVNFGVIYGMSGYGLSEELNIPRKEAEAYIQAYFNKYGKVKEFMEEQIRFCKENGYVKTILNRRRPVPEITSSNFNVRQMGERLAMNSPIQGSAADIIKIAMLRVYDQLNRKQKKARLVLQVHDELILEVPMEEQEEVELILIDCMQEAVKLSVPVDVDFHRGDNWFDLK